MASFRRELGDLVDTTITFLHSIMLFLMYMRKQTAFSRILSVALSYWSSPVLQSTCHGDPRCSCPDSGLDQAGWLFYQGSNNVRRGKMGMVLNSAQRGILLCPLHLLIYTEDRVWILSTSSGTVVGTLVAGLIRPRHAESLSTAWWKFWSWLEQKTHGGWRLCASAAEDWTRAFHFWGFTGSLCRAFFFC